MGSGQEGAADSVNAQLQGDGKPSPGCAVRGRSRCPTSVRVGLPDLWSGPVPCTDSPPNHRICRENPGLVVANVELSEKAQTTNCSWFFLEQDPCGPSSLSVPEGDSTADCAAVLDLLQEKWPFFRGSFSLVPIASQGTCVKSENRPALKGLLALAMHLGEGTPGQQSRRDRRGEDFPQTENTSFQNGKKKRGTQ